MTERVGYISNREGGYVMIDLSNLSDQQLLEVVHLAISKVEQIDECTRVFVDITHCVFNMKMLSYLKIAGKQVQPYIDKSAVIGVSSKNRIFFNLYLKFTGSKMRTFDTKMEALGYLNT